MPLATDNRLGTYRSRGTVTPIDTAASATSKVPTAIVENIDTLLDREIHEQTRRGWQLQIADKITSLAGSMAFVWLHVIWFGGWILVNKGLIPGVAPFDEYPFGLLTMIVSLEAIFLSTFVMISQNRMQAMADKRAELDLHVNLLAEREATQILKKLERIEERLGIEVGHEERALVRELTQHTNPVHIVEEIERKIDEKVDEKVDEIVDEIVDERVDERIEELIEDNPCLDDEGAKPQSPAA